MKNFLFVLAVALALFSIVSAIRWTKTDDEGNTYIRVIKVVRSPPDNPNTFEVRSVRKQVGEKNVDAIDILFSTAIVPRFVTRYFHKDSDSKELFLNRWALWKIFEYNETDGNPGFDPATEDIASSYHLFNRRFTTMTYHKETDTDGNTLHYVCSDLNPIDQSNPFPDVHLCAHMAEKTTKANRTRIHPNSVKWSVTISNYPYTLTDSRLGVKVSFDAKDRVKDLSETDASEEDDQNEAALDLTADSGDSGSRGIASWVTNVTVAGAGCSTVADVVRSVVFEQQVTKDIDTFPADPDSVSVDIKVRVSYFSFATDCQPSSITWDPELGVAVEDDDTSSALSLAVTQWMLVILAALALIW